MPISQQDLQNARLGALYLWQGTTHSSPLLQTIISGTLGSATALAGIKEINIALPDQTTDIVQFAIQAQRDPGAQGKLWKSVQSWAESLLGQLWAKIKDIFGDIVEVGVQVKKIALWVAQMVYSDLAPFIGGGSTLVSGLVKAGTAFVERSSSWLASKGVVLNTGHPDTLVGAINAGLSRALLDGVYDIARSSLSIGLNWATYGGAATVDAIAAVIDAAYKMVWRYAESCTITAFCQRAQQLWGNRTSKRGAVRKGATFTKWMEPAVTKVPLIAAVTLASGLTGDKMRFLNMFTDQDAVIGQSQFDKGCEYLEQVKRAASRMIVQSEIDFTSKDPLIDGLLKKAKATNLDSSPTTTWWGYWGLDKLFRS
ncbi:hypothetical protein ABXN37_26885 [Piscinibacter sakaiensis]|uniref:Uncharacterized protein n=1 Tax=Piscinibacter sakaiensis TaxID=1547922 RepID=A0A0K8P898_PISS1|nr:hypothetical protein [Piscinibacter sakaiensis]GAP38724.1 hypothetical protein ISF6_5277 [Piscinibacter sakaiensis]